MERLTDVRLLERRDWPDKGPVMRIALAGEQWESWVPGACLEAVYRSEGRFYLIFSSDDCPFEEGLHVILADDRRRLIDVAHIGRAYATGHLHNLSVAAPDQVAFSFYGRDRWCATVASGPLRPRPRWVPRPFWRGLHIGRLS